LQWEDAGRIAMARKHVNVAKDHIDRLAKTSALSAVEEMIWNALDAGSRRVETQLQMNDMGGVQNIEIVDHGTGIAVGELEQAFGSLGESKKNKQRETGDGRRLHGREGRGRFKALSLANNPQWESIYKSDGKTYKYQISISSLDPEFYSYTEPAEVVGEDTGTTVRLNNITQGSRSLCVPDIIAQLTRRFALYLSNYPGIQIIYDGRVLAVEDIIERKRAYVLPMPAADGAETTLTVIEWKFKLDSKNLHLCNESGFCRHEMAAGVNAPGIDYTAYLSSPVIERCYVDGQLPLEDLHDDLQKVIELAKEKLREHVRERLAEEAKDTVSEWQELEIYPYQKESTNPIEKAERQVFDIVALRVNEQHPTFKSADIENKKLGLALIRQALESNPSSLTKILKELVHLPKEEQDALADLLKRTPLTALIQAGSLVTQRLDTVQAFEHIIFDKDWKKKLLERTQLHRLLVHELWIFGEEYTLDNDDESLTEVLRKHVKKLGRGDLAPEVEVTTIQGVAGIPDLLMSRRFQYSGQQFENLVVELKRPSITIGQNEIGQLEEYATTVASDERFDTQKYIWRFVLAGNSLNEHAKAKSSQDGLPRGCSYKSKSGNVSVYIRCWAEILAEAKSRYEFFREKLQVEASKEYGIDYLQKHYAHLLTGRGASKKKDAEIMGAQQQD
jgi:hypothetical protein